MVKKTWRISDYVTQHVAGDHQMTTVKQHDRWGVRHFQALLLFLCLTIAYTKRVNLTVGIVAMTDRLNANPDFEEYEWDQQTQSTILSSFFWGYVFTQVPAGQLAERFGARLVVFYAMLISSMLTVLTPLAASYGGWQALCALRVLEGLCQGVIFPCSHALLSRWAPAAQRGQMTTYCYSGSQFGTVLMLSVSGVLASSALGWPSVFYLPGVLGCAWSALWLVCGSNSPAEHGSITAEERAFIEGDRVQTVAMTAAAAAASGDANAKQQSPPKRRTPWSAMLTSVPFLSLIVVHAAQNWGYWTLLTKMPVYMKYVLRMDIKQNALLSALPYLVNVIMCFAFSWLADVLSRREWLAPRHSRKFFNSVGHWIPMVALVALGYVQAEQAWLAVLLLVIAVSANAATYLGFQVNHLDLAPNFAGTLMGITNCVANIISIIAPLVVGFVVHEETSVVQWRMVFFIAAFVYFIGNLLFVIFSRTEEQPWNDAAYQQQGSEDDSTVTKQRQQQHAV